MTYTLDAFVKDAQAALKADNSPAGRDRVRVLLEKLLTNRQFVDQAVGADAPMGARKLYEDKDLGFVVLAPILRQLDRAAPFDDTREEAARADRRQLMRVADQDGLAAEAIELV